jgi:threonine dehydrogenase-like Zn-dependent dehydrogenase
MRAVVYEGPRKIVVKNVPEPTIEDPRDAIVKVTSAAICGSDLHFYDTVGTGQAPVARYNRFLRDLIVDGRAKPGAIVTQRVPLEAAPEAYAKFCARAPGYVKVVLKPEMAA